MRRCLKKLLKLHLQRKESVQRLVQARTRKGKRKKPFFVLQSLLSKCQCNHTSHRCGRDPSWHPFTRSTYPAHSSTSNDAIALDLQKIHDDLQAQTYTLQSLEDYVNKQLWNCKQCKTCKQPRLPSCKASLTS